MPSITTAIASLPDSLFVIGVLGEEILGRLTDSLQAVIEGGEVRATQPPAADDWIARLAAQQFAVDVPISNWSKAIGHSQAGRYAYVWVKISWIAGGVLAIILAEGLCWWHYRQ